MASLGNLVAARLGPVLRERGFEKNPGHYGVTLYSRSTPVDQHLVFDRVRGSDLRVFLAIGRIPHVGQEESSGTEAESPWWEVPDPTSLPSALDQAWEFLESCGFAWFDDPLALTPTQWRVQHGLLVRDSRMVGAVLTWPATLSLNERVLRVRRCVPRFHEVPALDVRSQLAGAKVLELGRMPLADAHELRLNAEAEGLTVEIRCP